jgi:O-antigen/teichoic acid export membrane protein
MDNLKEKTAKGLFWGAMNNGSTQVLNLLIGIFLGRLLTPAEYGIVGVLTIFTAVAGCLQASGFTQGLINLKSPTARDYNSVFWFNISASIILYAILFFCAPLIARYFKQPCLVEVSRVVFLVLPISALGIVYHAYLVKNMMNKEIAILAFWALSISGITGIVLAFNDFSYWSLVCQQLIYIIVLNIGRYYYVKWRPSFHIDFGPVRQMFNFCVKLLVTNVINTLNQHLLTFIFGRMFPIHTVGNYSQANKWNNMAHSTISNTIGQITQTVFVSVSDEQDRELHVFRKLLRFTAFLSFPAMFGLALVAHEFILCTIGPKWINCVLLLQILCIGGAFFPLHVLYQNLIIARGKSNLYMWCTISQIVVQLLAILLLHKKGITTIVCAYSLLNVIWLFVWQAIAGRMIGLRLLDMLKDVVPFMLIALLVMVATYFLTASFDALLLAMISRVVIAALLYALLMKLSHAKVMEECINFVRKKY